MQIVEPRRVKVWSALSDLFLDTELEDADYRRVAQLIVSSGYTAAEAQEILWQEVFPVLAPNLEHVAGEWVGWPADWLSENIKISDGAEYHRPSGSVAREIADCWARVEPLIRTSG